MFFSKKLDRPDKPGDDGFLGWERKDYGENRVNALGEIEGRIFFATYTRRSEIIRIISFRKANAREVRLYRAALGERSAPREG